MDVTGVGTSGAEPRRGVQLGTPAEPYVIAETACAHDGDPDVLRSLVREAAAPGPDAVQVEVFSPDHQVTPDHEMAAVIDDLAFSWETWGEVLQEMSEMEPATFVFAYDRPSLEFVLDYDVDGIKLSSADLANPEVVEFAARSGLPTTLSTGGCSMEDVARTVDQYTETADRPPILMHGVQNFPTDVENAWLNRIGLLREVFGLPVGYQDHTDGESSLSGYLDLMALGKGASVLEKHVALSRSETETDFEAALEPDEFAAYLETVRRGSAALGSRRFRSVSDSERAYQTFQKKAIVTTEAIDRGEPITRDRVEFLRNAAPSGMGPREFNAVEGKRAARDLPAYHTLTPGDVDSESG